MKRTEEIAIVKNLITTAIDLLQRYWEFLDSREQEQVQCQRKALVVDVEQEVQAILATDYINRMTETSCGRCGTPIFLSRETRRYAFANRVETIICDNCD